MYGRFVCNVLSFPGVFSWGRGFFWMRKTSMQSQKVWTVVSIFDHLNTYAACPKKNFHTNILFDRLLLWLQSAFAVALTTWCNVTTFISIQSLIFGRDFVLITEESNHSFSLFQHFPKTINGVKSGLCGGQLMCENDSLTLMCLHAPFFHN